MVVGTGKITLKLYDIHSLKGKRKIVKSQIQRLKNKFNISIAETGLNGDLEWAELGFSITGNDRKRINSTLDKIVEMLESMGLARITDTRIEIINY
ncbi:MAG: DUF503 domain-containing protein [Desulfobacteraceae bacterium]